MLAQASESALFLELLLVDFAARKMLLTWEANPRARRISLHANHWL